MRKGALFLWCLGWLFGSAAAAQHEGHTPPVGPTPTPTPEASPTNLFQSDMSLMTGMVPDDPMDGMRMRGWSLMDLGVARLEFNGQGGPSGRKGVESSNWNMLHTASDVGPGRLTLMMMNSIEVVTFPQGGSRSSSRRARRSTGNRSSTASTRTTSS